ncbi:MAG: YebC/PmpR family DNA-binding transcriptional regulator [Phototrophicales bacterium]|nr:YebC/PmpR family DNA-binding transcriptional regulator [Phototrophicales bacterium]
MSGHSKWSTIKRRKGAEDAKRGKIFTRLGRDITMAAREGGGDENSNPRLKLAVLKARQANMPKDNIERAIKKGTGELEGANAIEEITYEAYGLEGVALIIEVVTDNKNRTLAEVKHAINRAGGSLAASGSVSWQFTMKGYITVPSTGKDFEEIFMVAAEAGADDVSEEDDMFIIYTPREKYGAVAQALADAGYDTDESELQWKPQNETQVSTDKAIANLKLIEMLEDLDDTQSVATNLMITDDVAMAYENA